jgi:protein-L-isoaspartate(D-aspartate) O-methyltransferase
MDSHIALINHLTYTGVLKTPQVINAFKKIDRRDFLPNTLDERTIYDDHPLSIGFGQTISQPSTVAFMIELLQPQKGDTILDVGSGSGWTTALLAEIVGTDGRVYGVEIIPGMQAYGNANLAKYNYPHATIELAGKAYGLPDHAPYDKILVSAAGPTVPHELVGQLAGESIMVIPVGNEIERYIKRKNKGHDVERYYGFSFVPLVDPRW